MMGMDCANMMSGPGGVIMMIGMAVFWLLLIAVLILAAAALLKYMRTNERP